MAGGAIFPGGVATRNLGGVQTMPCDTFSFPEVQRCNGMQTPGREERTSGSYVKQTEELRKARVDKLISPRLERLPISQGQDSLEVSDAPGLQCRQSGEKRIAESPNVDNVYLGTRKVSHEPHHASDLDAHT